MMLPRAGGRKFSDVQKIVTAIFERNIEDWAADNETFTGKKSKARTKSKAAKPAKAKPKKKPKK